MTGANLDPYHAFEAPWHAEVFALAIHLNEKGHFSWVEWSNLLGENLKKYNFGQESVGSDLYYQAWLQTLIEIMRDKEIFDNETFNSIRDQWVNAYIKTPHGEPVCI